MTWKHFPHKWSVVGESIGDSQKASDAESYYFVCCSLGKLLNKILSCAMTLIASHTGRATDRPPVRGDWDVIILKTYN